MDIISGIVVTTSVFLFSTALVVLFARVSPGEAQRSQDLESAGVVRKASVTLLVVYFVAVLNLLLIAQQVNLALGSFVVGLVLLVVFYVEPALRPRTAQGTEESENWER